MKIDSNKNKNKSKNKKISGFSLSGKYFNLTKIFNVLAIRKIFGKNLYKHTIFCSTKLF
jgi:hypothetical protein